MLMQLVMLRRTLVSLKVVTELFKTIPGGWSEVGMRFALGVPAVISKVSQRISQMMLSTASVKSCTFKGLCFEH